MNLGRSVLVVVVAVAPLATTAACSERELRDPPVAVDSRRLMDQALALAEPAALSGDWLAFASQQADYEGRLEAILSAPSQVDRPRGVLGDDLEAVRGATARDWPRVRAKVDADLAKLDATPPPRVARAGDVRPRRAQGEPPNNDAGAPVDAGPPDVENRPPPEPLNEAGRR